MSRSPGRSSALALTATTALAPAVWGSTYLVTTELLPPGHPLWLGVIRALPAGLVILALTRRLPHGGWWWRAAVLGTMNIGAFFALLFVAAYRLPGGVAATLGGASPLLVAGLGALVLGERPTRARLGFGVLGLVGVALMVLRADAALDAVGVAAGLAGTVSMAAGIVLTKRWGRPVGPVTFTAWQLTAGGLVLLPLALAAEGAPPPVDAPALAGYGWLALVGTLGGYLLWFRGLGSLPVSATSFLGLVSPGVATLLGWLVLDQDLTGLQATGFALAMAAVVGAQPISSRRSAETAPPPESLGTTSERPRATGTHPETTVSPPAVAVTGTRA
ncbi:putative blue pigment (indigoidine) exporter [Georgenia soli]|uniref:Putative blue pigment (Indigoidine) exporter n=1 Tax=Georgenia soli TaxID=638953 RepID=A0A2A9ER56_9MICO|nr:EamA family transporter [Georgenia soli]PFG41011.1 putative blue pigment (indigoidine) exporter [Georgenia soli]